MAIFVAGMIPPVEQNDFLHPVRYKQSLFPVCRVKLYTIHVSPSSQIYQACFSLMAWRLLIHYNDVTMGAIVSQITSLTIVFSTVYLDTDQRIHQSSASLAFVRGIHRRPVNSPHKWPVTRKMFPFDDVIMTAHMQQQITWPGGAGQ